jgi:Flp pilus assembly protein CpaB
MAVEEDANRTVQVLVAARDLAPKEVLDADSVVVREVIQRVAPEGSYTDPVQVIGRVLTVPVMKVWTSRVDSESTPRPQASRPSFRLSPGPKT